MLSIWWIYFARSSEELLDSFQRAFSWGYGHYSIFAAVAAVGAGLAVSVDRATGHTVIGELGANLAIAIPVAVFITGIWSLHYRFRATNV